MRPKFVQWCGNGIICVEQTVASDILPKPRQHLIGGVGVLFTRNSDIEFLRHRVTFPSLQQENSGCPYIAGVFTKPQTIMRGIRNLCER